MGLREQATLDARAILEDDSGFAWPVTLTSPLGVVTALRGFTTDVGQTIDPETGQAVAGQRASFACARAALPALPEAVAERGRRPWIATFADSRGVVGTWKVVEVLPDSAVGVVVLLLEVYQRRVIIEGSLALPSLQVAGSIAPRVAALAGALALPSGLQLSGTIAPRVALAGALALPSGLQLSGTIRPRMALAGSLALPSLQVAGSIAPRVSLAGSLALPSLQLSGTLTAGTNPATAWYRMASSTPVGGEWQTIVDVFGGSAMVQNDTDRRLASGTSGGLPIGTYDGTDCIRMPLGANNFNVNKFGFALWFRHFSPAGQIFSIYNNDAGLRVLNVYCYPTGQVYIEIQFINNADGRFYQTATGAVAVDGGNNFLRFQWDGSKSNEFDATGSDTNAKVRLFVGETGKALTAGNLGAGGAASVLRSPSGAAVWGGLADTDTPPNGLANGWIHGGNTYLLTATPSAAQGLAYKNFEPLT